MKLTYPLVNCILLFAAVVLIWGQRTTTPAEEETPIEEHISLMIANDKKLCEEYAQKKKGNGVQIMTMIREYNDALADIVKRGFRDRKDKDNTTEVEARPLFEHGGPEFINFYVEPPLLEERFGLDNKSSRLLGCQRQNTIDLWEDFYTLYSKIPDKDDDSISI